MTKQAKVALPPALAEWLLEKLTMYDSRYGSIGDFHEDYLRHLNARGSVKARLWYWTQVLQACPRYVMQCLYWRSIMISNYLKIAWRAQAKHKNFALLNTIGLSIALAACLFIALYINYELSYDRYHPAYDRLYRVAKRKVTNTAVDLLAANVTDVAPTLKERFPEVEEAARAGTANYRSIDVNGVKYLHDKMLVADEEIFNIMHIPFIRGSKDIALKDPNSIVLSESTALKYFGTINVINQTLLIDSTSHTITGIVKDCPGNTHLQYELIKKLIIDTSHPFHYPWNNWHCMNYIRLAPGINPQEFEAKIKWLPHEYQGDYFKQRGFEFTLFLQPVKDIHLHSHLNWEISPPGNALYITVFSAAGLFILAIACMNFMNLATARSAGRASEVGIRKVSGAQRIQLAIQFIGEALAQVAIAQIIAIITVFLLLPFFNQWAGLKIGYSLLFTPGMITSQLVLILMTGIIGGSYPAFYLSGFQPVSILKGSMTLGIKSGKLRKVLVVSQFAISIALMAATLLFYRQVDFMKNHPLGFSKDQKLVIEFNRRIITPEHFQSIKNEFSNHPAVLNSTFSSSVPGRWMYFWNMKYGGGGNEGSGMMNAFQIDADFLNTYQIELVTGSGFEKVTNRDGWLINEAAVEKYGWPNAETALQGYIQRPSAPIIGVMKNFHLRGLQEPVAPVCLFYMSEDFRYLTLTIDTRQTSDVLTFVKEKHEQLFPGKTYEHFFLDRDFDTQYAAEDQRTRLFTVFAVLGIVIAGLGLLGLSAFIAERRTKEIGIRKTMGASVQQIVFMLTREFTAWIVLANLLAWPLTWLAMDHWFNDFAFRIKMTPLPLIYAGLAALLIAWATISYHAVKAGHINPSKALKYE